MKSLPLWITLVILLLGSCRNDSLVGPSDLLYKRWHLAQFKRVGANAWTVLDTNAYYDTEYRSDGILVYRRNGVVAEAGCCRGSQFERNGTLIHYTEFPDCPFVKCASIAHATITVLKDNLLELQEGDLISQYVPTN